MMEQKDWKSVPTVTKLNTIAKKAKEDRRLKFNSLLHLLNKEYLLDCYRLLKKHKASGIDGRTVESYTETEIDKALESTAKQILRGKYNPPPVRRVYIAKENGKMRGLGIPTVIDKVVQLAVTRILMAIFDSSFTDSSYGYRNGRDAHACLKAINNMIRTEKVNYIIDADITGYFDNIDHTWMMRCLTQRINDKAFLRIIWKWLKAGVMEQQTFTPTDKGTPQGGIVSPVLSNIYLHFVLDLWMNAKEKKKLYGFTELLRYADDFIIGVQYEYEAEIIFRDIQERFKKFGLTLSLEKTKIVAFGKYAAEREKRKGRKPGIFTFLGFTHSCGETRSGRFRVKAQTSSNKLRKSLSSMKSFLKENKTDKLEKVWKEVAVKLTGHYNYYGISGNYKQLRRYYNATENLLFKWLNRRGQRRSFSWEEFGKYSMHNQLPQPKITYAFYQTGGNIISGKGKCFSSESRMRK
jgi:group II intron reverse transcriptase/maturase